MSQIEPGHVETELEGMTPTVRNAFLRNLRAVFNFGIKRGWLEKTPIAKLDFQEVTQSEVVTLSPKEAQSLMLAAESKNELLTYHAIGLFAGVRPLELERLEWKHVDFEEKHIEITAAVSKTGRRRIIDMSPNLHAWLLRYVANAGATKGKVTPRTNLRTQPEGDSRGGGPRGLGADVMRHSFASNWLAEHGDINRLTLQMGHESTDMLFRHYNRTCKRKDAAKYWQIMPSPSARGRKIVSMAAA